jgi:tetratricopeptide (TPR) repeat protein
MQLDHYLVLSLGALILTVLIFLIHSAWRAYRSGRLAGRSDGADVVAVRRVPSRNCPEFVSTGFDVSTIIYLVVVLVAAGLLATYSSRWLPAGDDVSGLAPFAETLRLGQITGTEPFHGTGTPVTPRNELVVWNYLAILMCKIAGTSPAVFFVNSRPILVILAFLALYVFLHQFFRNRNQSLFLLSLWSIFLLVSLQADGTGSDLMTRIIQDKFLGWFIVVPIVLVFMLWFLEARSGKSQVSTLTRPVSTLTHRPRRPSSLGYLVGLGIGALGAAMLHPITLTQVLVLGGSFGLLYLVFVRTKEAFLSLTLVALVLLLCLAVPVVQYFRYVERMPVELAGLGDAVEYGRIYMSVDRYRLWLLDGNLSILHPSIVLTPVILLGYLLLPLLLPLVRQASTLARNPARLIVGSMVALPIMLYVPPVAAIVGKFVTPYLLWRLAWPLSLFAVLTVGWVAWMGVTILAGWMGKFKGFRNRDRAPGEYPRASAPVAALRTSVLRHAGLLAIIALAFVAAWPSIESGLTNFEERLAAAEFTTCSTAQQALQHLDQLALESPVDVLASKGLNFCIPGYAALANVIEYRGYGTVNRLPVDLISVSLQRAADSDYFSLTTAVDDLVLDIIERYGIEYIMVEKDRLYLDLQLRLLPDMFESVYDDGDYAIYSVKEPLSTPALSAHEGPALHALRESEGSAHEGSLLVEGNTALRHRRWDEAEEIFAQIVQNDPTQVLAYWGLGLAHERRGEIQQALVYYEEASRRAQDEPALHARLAETYLLLRDAESAAVEYERAATLAPERHALHASQGFAELLTGQEEAARAGLERSAALQASAGTATYYSVLGDKMMSAKWTSEALKSYEKALDPCPV